MLLEMPRHTEIFGSLKIHEVQRILKLDSGDFTNPRARDIPFDEIKDILRRTAIIVPVKDERTHLLEGYQVKEVVKEIGSGLNDNRKRLLKILRERKATKIIIEDKDRLTKFCFNYLKTLLANQGREIEVVNESKEDKKELMDDLIAIITSFCARYYGLRRSKRKTERII